MGAAVIQRVETGQLGGGPSSYRSDRSRYLGSAQVPPFKRLALQFRRRPLGKPRVKMLQASVDCYSQSQGSVFACSAGVMAEVKGVQLKGTVSFLKERYGESAINRAIEALAPEDRAVLPAVFLDSSWYGDDVWRAVRRLTRSLTADAGPDLPIDLGKHISQYTFTGVYRSLLVQDPRKQAEKFAWIYDFFFRDAQKVETKFHGNSSCTITYYYKPGEKPTRSTCAGTLGYSMRTLELAGGSNVRGTHKKCAADGQPCCEYFLEWE